MPFVKKDLRPGLLDGSIKPEAPGDLCFLEYQKLMDAWATSRRWTTAHNECKRVLRFLDDETTAEFLAFLEFYIRHVHKYETEKMTENGDIAGRPAKSEVEVLKERVAVLKQFGDDLAAAIQQAAWDSDLSGPTFHMRSAVENWKEMR